MASVGENGYEYQFSQVIGNNIIQSDTYTAEKSDARRDEYISFDTF